MRFRTLRFMKYAPETIVASARKPSVSSAGGAGPRLPGRVRQQRRARARGTRPGQDGPRAPAPATSRSVGLARRQLAVGRGDEHVGECEQRRASRLRHRRLCGSAHAGFPRPAGTAGPMSFWSVLGVGSLLLGVVDRERSDRGRRCSVADRHLDLPADGRAVGSGRRPVRSPCRGRALQGLVSVPTAWPSFVTAAPYSGTAPSTTSVTKRFAG